MKKRSILKLFTLAAIGAMALAGPARAGSFDAEATRFVGSLGAKTAVLVDNEDAISEAERAQKLFGFVDNVVDIPAIAKFTMGRYWRQASEQQRAEFKKLFRGYVAYSVADRIKALAGASIKVQKVVPVKASKAKDVLVICRIDIGRGRSLAVVWRVRKTEAGPRLVDVIVDGISMAVVQREEFASVIRAQDGNIGSFLTALREKTGGAAAMVAER
jgi:phospholipid transport system substrate-binding protein